MRRLLLFFLVLAPSLVLAGKADFAVKLPDGLYLYQPDYRRNVFSPLVIVEQGKFVDPYHRGNELGTEKFYEKYLRGKVFGVYAGFERVGELKNVTMDDGPKCWKSNFVSEKYGSGQYRGKPLPGKYVFEMSNNPFQSEIFDTLRAIIVPAATWASKPDVLFEIDKSDTLRAQEIARRELAPYVSSHVRELLKSQISEELRELKSSIKVLFVRDLDGNGKKDFVGVYSLTVGDRAGRIEQVFDTPFVIWDSSKLERLSAGYPKLGIGRLIFSGAIDFDHDGIQELVLQTEVYGKGEEPDTGKYIEIFRRAPNGWLRVFRSVDLCVH